MNIKHQLKRKSDGYFELIDGIQVIKVCDECGTELNYYRNLIKKHVDKNYNCFCPACKTILRVKINYEIIQMGRSMAKR